MNKHTYVIRYADTTEYLMIWSRGTGIGPELTMNLEDALLFDTRLSATDWLLQRTYEAGLDNCVYNSDLVVVPLEQVFRFKEVSQP